MRIRWILMFAAAVLAAVSVVRAEEKPSEAKPVPAEPAPEAKPEAEKPKGPEMDELSKQTLAAYREKVFDVSEQAIRKASFHVKVTAGDQEITGRYRMESEEGAIAWDDPEAAAPVAALEGQITRMLLPESDEMRFGSAKLTATKAEDGRVVIAIDGETPRNFRRMEFDPKGILEKVVVDPGIGEIDVAIHHAEHDGRLLMSGQRIDMMLQTQVTRIEFATVGEFVVPTRFTVEQESAAGKAVVQYDFTDWKLNDDVKDAEKTAEEAPPPAEPAPEPDDERK